MGLEDWDQVAPKGIWTRMPSPQESLPDVALGSLGDFKLGLEFKGHVLPGYGRCSLSETCAFTLEAKNLKSYEFFEKLVHQFTNFVALGVGRPVYALSLKARITNPKS